MAKCGEGNLKSDARTTTAGRRSGVKKWVGLPKI
jgi:hypothetical protein